MNETARDYAETKRGLKNQIQERARAADVLLVRLCGNKIQAADAIFESLGSKWPRSHRSP